MKLYKDIDEVVYLTDYSYEFERKDFFVPYIPNFRLKNIHELKKRLFLNQNIIVYGLGKAGKIFLEESIRQESDFLNRIAICDNTYRDTKYKGFQVLKHKECIKKYPNALYIITVQKECVDIISDLIYDNVEKVNIMFFSLATGMVV